MQLREHQKQCIENLRRDIGLGLKFLCVSAPCSFGKTIVFCHIAKSTMAKNKKIVIVVDAVFLAEQTKNKLLNFVDESEIDVCCGTLKQKKIDKNIVIATIQTLKNLDLKEVDVLIFDEVHSGLSRSKKLIEKLNIKSCVIGFTATPYNSKGIAIFGKGKFFEKLSYDCSIDFLTENKYLLPFVYEEDRENIIDISHVKVTNTGEFNEKELAKTYSVNKDKISSQINDMLDKTKNREKIVIMCVGIDHANFVHSLLDSAVLYHSKISHEERTKNLEEFDFGKARYLIGVSAIYKGLDVPKIDCLVIMRPIASLSFYVQFIGRGARLFGELKNCLVLDYGQVISRLGMFNKIKPSSSKKEADRNKKEAKKTKKCPICGNICHIQELKCINCDFVFKKVDLIKKASELDLIANSFLKREDKKMHLEVVKTVIEDQISSNGNKMKVVKLYLKDFLFIVSPNSKGAYLQFFYVEKNSFAMEDFSIVKNKDIKAIDVIHKKNGWCDLVKVYE